MKIDWAVLDNYLDRGLSAGVGEPDKQVCVEAAICLALGLPLGDDPPCVAPTVRAFKIALNDGPWSSPKARAAGMRALAYAQIGTRGHLDEKKWVTRVAELTIREVLPPILRQVGLEKEAKRCEEEGTEEAAAEAATEAARAARAAARAARAAAWAAARAAAEAATEAAWAARAAAWAAARAATEAAWAARAAAWAAARAAAEAATEAAWAARAAAAEAAKYLLISANLALRALEEQGFTVERARALEEV
jgi:hypothetical protein